MARLKCHILGDTFSDPLPSKALLHCALCAPIALVQTTTCRAFITIVIFVKIVFEYGRGTGEGIFEEENLEAHALYYAQV